MTRPAALLRGYLSYDYPLCGYSRLSVDRNGDKLGYEVQEGDGNVWGRRQDPPQPIEWYRDKNESAAVEDLYREHFERMLADVEAGLFKGIIVWRIDRLTRLPPVFERILEILRKVGGFIYSVDERLDSRNEGDLLNMRLKVLMGDSEVKGTRRRIRANKENAKWNGFYTGGGHRPYGFEAPMHDEWGRIANKGRVGVAHVEHEVGNLRDAARRIAWEGESYLDVINRWHTMDPPVYGAMGAPWSTKTLQYALTSPRMIGKQAAIDPESREQVLRKAIWEPVLDERTWRQLLAVSNPRTTRYRAIERYLLTRLARCGRCGQGLIGGTRSYEKGGEMMSIRQYRCPSHSSYRERGSCGKLNVIAEPVEQIVIAKMLVRVERTAGAARPLVADQDGVIGEIEQLSGQRVECERQLEEVQEAYRKRLISLAEWISVRDPVQVEVDQLDASMKALANRLDVPVPTGADVADLWGWFDGLSFRQQKLVLNAHVRDVVVLAPGRSGRYFRPERVVVTLADLEVADGEGD